MTTRHVGDWETIRLLTEERDTLHAALEDIQRYHATIGDLCEWQDEPAYAKANALLPIDITDPAWGIADIPDDDDEDAA